MPGFSEILLCCESGGKRGDDGGTLRGTELIRLKLWLCGREDPCRRREEVPEPARRRL